MKHGKETWVAQDGSVVEVLWHRSQLVEIIQTKAPEWRSFGDNMKLRRLCAGVGNGN